MDDAEVAREAYRKGLRTVTCDCGDCYAEDTKTKETTRCYAMPQLALRAMLIPGWADGRGRWGAFTVEPSWRPCQRQV